MAAGLVLASMVFPFGIGALLGPLPHDVPLEPRTGWIIGLATAIAIAAWSVQREADRARRLVPAAALVLPLAHVVLSGSSVVAALDATAYLAIALTVATRAPWRVLTRHHGSRPRNRVAAVALMVGLLHGPLAVIGLGLVSCIVIPSITRLVHRPPALVGTERAIAVITDDGLTLRATYWPGLPGGPAVVLAHGRGDGRDRMLGWARDLCARGAHVLAYDARGHGASDGAVVTFADREPGDVVRAAEVLLERSGSAPERLALMGVSMGGGAVLGALPELDRRGMRRAVLLSPASDYDFIVGRYMPPPPLRGPSRAIVLGVSWAMGFHAPFEQIPGAAIADAPDVTALVLHPRLDGTIPLALSEHLVAAYPNVSLRIVETGGHDGFESAMLADAGQRDAILAALGVTSE